MINVTLLCSNPESPTTIKIENDSNARRPDSVLLTIDQDSCEDNHYKTQHMLVRLNADEVAEFVQALNLTQ